MALAKVLRRGQITLPKETRDKLALKVGDLLDVEVKESEIIIRPKAAGVEEGRLTDYGKEQLAKGIQDYKKGKVKSFDQVDDLITYLNS
ncbi:MAG: AbrB/MazE/SpoVT family DNA-binding domain-containing protein [Deltaproteobacteria bacterium]|nr:AbrB/MazE/SpoVT family DNA-binding domain-containing protein [Deltaproteobacteria bacterium]